MARGVFIVGEDEVTRAIVTRIIEDYATHLQVIQYIPARGSEIKAKMASLNTIAVQAPVILLADMDTNACAPIAKANLLSGVQQSPEFVVSIAVDEAETWLLADTEGFASYFGIPINQMPRSSMQRFMGPHARVELEVPLKTSYYLTHTLISYSNKTQLKSQLYSSGACKGKEYNEAVIPFIRSVWNVESARKNSYSLDRMIIRIQSIHP